MIKRFVARYSLNVIHLHQIYKHKAIITTCSSNWNLLSHCHKYILYHFNSGLAALPFGCQYPLRSLVFLRWKICELQSTLFTAFAVSAVLSTKYMQKYDNSQVSVVHGFWFECCVEESSKSRAVQAIFIEQID